MRGLFVILCGMLISVGLLGSCGDEDSRDYGKPPIKNLKTQHQHHSSRAKKPSNPKQRAPRVIEPFRIFEKGGGGHCLFHSVAAAINQKDNSNITQQDVRDAIGSSVDGMSLNRLATIGLQIQRNANGVNGRRHARVFPWDTEYLEMLTLTPILQRPADETTEEGRQIVQFITNLGDTKNRLRDDIRSLINGRGGETFWGDSVAIRLIEEEYDVNVFLVERFDENSEPIIHNTSGASDASRCDSVVFLLYSPGWHYQVLGAKDGDDNEVLIYERSDINQQPQAVYDLLDKADRVNRIPSS